MYFQKRPSYVLKKRNFTEQLCSGISDLFSPSRLTMSNVAYNEISTSETILSINKYDYNLTYKYFYIINADRKIITVVYSTDLLAVLSANKSLIYWYRNLYFFEVSERTTYGVI